MNVPVSLQLYSLREDTEKDFIGTLTKVSALGYKGVEFAGYGNLRAPELKAALNRLGLTPSGSHVAVDLLDNRLDDVIAFNLEIGNEYIVCPWNKYESRQDYVDFAKKMNEWGKKCRDKGLWLCYHNHAHEFETFDGEYGLDILYKETDPALVKAEIDTYWVKRAGIDPIAYIRKYSGRVPMIHIKDMEPETMDFAEIGYGTMDISGITDAAKDAGAKWFIVEQDKSKRSAIESVRMSIETLKKMNLV